MGGMCSRVFPWVQCISVCSCAFHAVLLREALKSVTACHLAVAQPSLPPPWSLLVPPPCQKSTKFAPLTSGSDPHDTSHYYHHPLETQQHRGLRHDSGGRWCIGLMSSAPWALCLGYVAFMISIHKKPKYLGCAMGLYMGPICLVSVKQPGRLAG